MVSTIIGVMGLVLATRVLGQDTSTVCQIPGDSDILGIGVRLGLYFQFTSNLLVTLVRPEEALGSLLVSSMLGFGILIATIYSLANNNLPPGSFISTQWYFLPPF
jgi:hypothetical protein